jgi:uncharacterized protein (TIGR02266 family)
MYCGFCGYKLSAIEIAEHQRLAAGMQPLEVQESPQLLQKVKRVEAHAAQELTRRANDPADGSVPGVDWESDTLPVDSRAVLEEVAREQRQYRRFPVAVEVGYASDHNFYTGFTQNLSHGGLFVATHMLGEIGDVLALTFSVPGLRKICTGICQVQWIREYNPDYPDSVPGMGLRFLKLEPEARAAIELFISHRRPIFFE